MAHSIISISDSQVNGADQVLVSDSNSKIPAIDGSQLTLLNATTVASGTIASARLDVGTTANKLIQLDGNAKLPAVDASQLTGIVSATISASDPTLSTNPSGGVGTEWNNSTTGEMYICTDATAGENVWKNVGGGSGDIKPFHGWGTNYGYVAGGVDVASGSANNTIDRFSFSSATDATDVGNLLTEGHGPSGSGAHGGSSSSTHGYAAGGDPGPGHSVTIQKWTFAATADATDVGDCQTSAGSRAGFMSTTHGYATGGSPSTDSVDKYAYASDGNSVDLCNLHHGARYLPAGATSETAGYTHGGRSGSSNLNYIEKITFSSDSSSVDHADLANTCKGHSGHNSETHGYAAGGYSNNQIQKFTFASATNATDVSDIRYGQAGHMSGNSSSTHGYITTPNYINQAGSNASQAETIEKFSYASGADSVDSNQDLTLARQWAGANQSQF